MRRVEENHEKSSRCPDAVSVDRRTTIFSIRANIRVRALLSVSQLVDATKPIAYSAENAHV
jgi:hypothetical protein